MHFFTDARVNEAVHFLRMAVKIQAELDVVESGHQFGEKEYLRMKPPVGLAPLPIQVKTREIGPKIAIDHAIRVDHGHYDEFVLLHELIFMNQIFEEIF